MYFVLGRSLSFDCSRWLVAGRLWV